MRRYAALDPGQLDSTEEAAHTTRCRRALISSAPSYDKTFSDFANSATMKLWGPSRSVFGMSEAQLQQFKAADGLYFGQCFGVNRGAALVLCVRS